ncbi:MAG: hypothetical protein ACNA77_08290 [Opitutales bacterium]
MKAILPILICSAISAALGYYFGRITLPTQQTAPVAATSSQKPGATTTVAPVAKADLFEDGLDAGSLDSESDLEPKPEPEQVAATPTPTESDFAARAAQSIHTLTDTQGRSINARIVEVTATDVKIRRTDGLETNIPLNMLSEEDVAFCNYLREQQKAKEVKAPDTSGGFDWDSYFNS